MKRSYRSIVTCAVAALVAIAAPAFAQKTSWDRVRNIKQSALQLAELQKSRGALGTFQHIAACYKTHSLASAYGQSFENCLVLDYIHSKVTAAVYARVPAEERKKNDAPDPQALVDTMLRRIGGGFEQYKLTEKDARGFLALVDKHGVPAFDAARFDKSDTPRTN
jgi:hypothetical protein